MCERARIVVAIAACAVVGCDGSRPAAGPGSGEAALAAVTPPALTATSGSGHKPPAAVACPDDTALIALARRLFAPPSAEDDVVVRCLALVAERAPLWLIDGYYTTPDYVFERRTMTVDPATRAPRWTATRVANDNTLDGYRAVDLDGDGSSELLQTMTFGGGNGLAWEELHIVSVHAGTLVDLGGLPVRYENTGAVAIGTDRTPHRCASAIELIDQPDGSRQIAIDGEKRRGKPPGAHCPGLGRHVYELTGNNLEEVGK